MSSANLPYEIDSLEPFISRKNLETHFFRYYQEYAHNIDLLTINTVFENTAVDELIKLARGPVHYNAIQTWNHAFYFTGMRHGPNHLSDGSLLLAINGCFGSFRYFSETLIKYARSFKGHGWLWVVLNSSGTIEIIKESKLNHPLLKDMIPILNCDLYEHAYSLDYINNIRGYVDAYLKVVDWKLVENRYNSAIRINSRKRGIVPQI